ncbi:hypothetical protein [Yersinia proxima]|uniref:hypothetical protein n=1 Tax=Yersinia proxima TaxID=2890316 RepID=UPI001D12BBDF|nr:hypothetical protein [Yersinia proxima]
MSVLFLDDASRFYEETSFNDAEIAALELINVLKGIRKINKKIAINTATPIHLYLVSNNYSLQQILRGNNYTEEWAFIRMLNDYSPFSVEVEKYLEEVICSELRTEGNGIQSSALAWAMVLDTAVVSFNFNNDWSRSWVKVIYSTLDDNGEIISHNSRVKNACNENHLEEHTQWLRNLGLGSVPDVEKIWSERASLYPKLRFLPRVKKDLKSLENSGLPFTNAILALEILSKDAINWTVPSLWPVFSTKESPEGETRKRLCWVFDEDTSSEELFDWHIRFTGNVAGRIHFRVDQRNHNIVVAYIGAKTMKKICDA